MNRGKYVQIDESRPRVDRQSGWYIFKVILRVLSVLICLAVVGVAVSTVVDIKLKYGVVINIAYYASPPAIILLIWDAVEFIALCARKGQGIHPGAHVAVELIMWIACTSIAGLAFVYAYGIDKEAKAGEYYTVEEEGLLKGIAMKTRVLSGLLCLVALVRFILFVRACVETHRRRMARHFRPTAVSSGVAAVPLGHMQPQPYDPTSMVPAVHAPQPQQYYYDQGYYHR